MKKIINTIVIGGGQAGLAASEHLTNNKIDHIILEKNRIVERWRSCRWDSLVANGPAWHDRFPTLEFTDINPNSFASKEKIIKYFEDFSKKINAPIHLNINVEKVIKLPNNDIFEVTTTDGVFESNNIIAATGAFQEPVYPKIIPKDSFVKQIHSQYYKNPKQIVNGAVLVVGSGSSGSQIADELNKSKRDVFLSIGPHDRPPRRYRDRDNVWWLRVLGKWEIKTPNPKTQHVTIAVSGYDGGKTIDFRKLANNGITLVGMTKKFKNEKIYFADDLRENIINGDKNYLNLLEEADAYVQNHNLNFPEEPEAKVFDSDPKCMRDPILELDLKKFGINTVIWATGYKNNFEWMKLNVFDKFGKPIHKNGISNERGIYFLGLPWLSMRGSSFIWGVWKDAKYLAEHIANN